MVVSGVCTVAAAFLLLRWELNAAFVVATVGIVAWFLNYRMQMKAIVDAAELEQSTREEIEDGEDSDDN
jgi:hypothetical protein